MLSPSYDPRTRMSMRIHKIQRKDTGFSTKKRKPLLIQEFLMKKGLKRRIKGNNDL